MKKIFTFLVAFLTTVSGAVWAEENPSGTSDTNPYDLADEELKITNSEEYWVTCSSETNNRIIISGGDRVEPTIHLIDIKISHDGTAIEVDGNCDPTLVLHGENYIKSNHGPAISVPHDANTSLLISGTGSLDIQMSSTDYVAIGNSYVGSYGTSRTSGEVEFQGGTVTTNGKMGNFIDRHMNLNGNAVVIVGEIDGNIDRNKGLLAEGSETATIYGDEVTLQSPFPEPYKINLESGKNLGLGDQTLNIDQLIDNGGQAKGYKVVYSSPTDVPMNVSGELPANKFVGSKYTVEQWNPTATVKEENTTYEHIATHWLKDGTTWVNANSEVTETPAAQYTSLTEMETKEYQAVWYLEKKSVSYSLTTGFTGAFNLWYPEVAHLFKATEQTGGELKTLAQLGLTLDDESGNTVEAGNPITDEGTFTSKLNLASSTTNAPNGLVTELTVTTDASELKLDNEDEVTITFNGGDFTYNGKEQTEIGTMVSVTSVKNPNLKLTYGTYYFLKFSQEGKDATFQDKGDYTVTVVAVEENGLLTGEKELTGKTATIKPATLKVSEVSDVEWNIKDSGTPAYEAAEFTLGTIYSVGETKDEVSINATAEGFTATPTGNTWQTTPGTYTVNYSGLALTGSRAFNYTLDPATAEGKLVVSVEGSDKDPIDDEGEDPLIASAGDWDNGTRTYDGKPHPLTAIEVKNGTETERVSISLTDVEITYSYKQTEEAEETTPEAVQNVGTYTATFTFPENEYGYKGIGKVSLTIEKATLTATTTGEMPQIGVGESLEDIKISSKDATQYIKFEGLQNDEVAAYTGTLKADKDLDTSTEGELENAYTVDVTLAPEGTFDPNNYTTPSYKDIKVSAVVGKITINPGGDGEGGEEGDDVIGGEDTDGDGNFPSEGDFILISPDGEECSVYDGQPHELKILQIGDYTLKAGTDYNVTSYGITGNPKNAGTYSAKIELVADGKYQLENGETSFDLTIHITKRPVTVDFGNFPASIDIDTETLDASLYAIWQKEGEVANEGLIDGEEPIYEGTLVLTPSKEYPDYFNVYLDRETFKVEDNDSFFVNNYEINIYDEEGEKWITLEEDEDGEATLPDDEDDPLVDTPDEEGGIEIEDGSSTSGGGYYQDWNDLIIYESEGATLKSRYDKMRVKDGGKFTLSLTIDEAYAGAEPVVYYRRGRGGDWTPLKISINGLYHVDNVYTDIYVKVMGDSIWVVGNEDITATDARAYAQPNKIVVITPQPTDVQIISMAGAVVATDKVTGQREFANLTEGVYIVRMGETVVKLQVRK